MISSPDSSPDNPGNTQPFQVIFLEKDKEEDLPFGFI